MPAHFSCIFRSEDEFVLLNLDMFHCEECREAGQPACEYLGDPRLPTDDLERVLVLEVDDLRSPWLNRSNGLATVWQTLEDSWPEGTPAAKILLIQQLFVTNLVFSPIDCMYESPAAHQQFENVFFFCNINARVLAHRIRKSYLNFPFSFFSQCSAPRLL